MTRLSKKSLDGNVETLLLAVLEDGPNYGYEIVQQLNRRAPGLLKLGEGTVYPVLHRLEDRGLVSSFWRKGETGRERKYYRITGRGGHALKANREQWRSLTEVMELMLGKPTPPDKRSGGYRLQGESP